MNFSRIKLDRFLACLVTPLLMLNFSGCGSGAPKEVPSNSTPAAPQTYWGSEDVYSDIRQILYKKEIQSHLHRDLVATYKADAREGFLEEANPRAANYTIETFPVTIGSDEEWPTLTAGASHLLQSPTRDRLMASCRKLRASPAKPEDVISRVLLQADLWVAFDQVYAAGAHPVHSKNFNPAVWREVLRELACTIWHLALKPEEVQALPDTTALRRELMGLQDPAKIPFEYYSLEAPQIHDIATGFRRAVHYHYWSSQLNPNKAEADNISALEKGLGDGGVAQLVENAITLTTEYELVETNIPIVIKHYRVSRDKNGKNIRTWDLYKLKHNARSLDKDSFEHGKNEAWALIDLPNIPGFRNQPAFRAPLSVACATCHLGDPSPKAFQPNYFRREEQYMRITATPQTFTSKRTIDFKSTSLEYRMLVELINEYGASQ